MHEEQKFNLSKNESSHIAKQAQVVSETHIPSAETFAQEFAKPILPIEFREKLSIHAEGLRDSIGAIESFMYSLNSPEEQSRFIERIKDIEKHLDSITTIIKTYEN